MAIFFTCFKCWFEIFFYRNVYQYAFDSQHAIKTIFWYVLFFSQAIVWYKKFTDMITQYEVIHCLRNELPQLSEDLDPSRIGSSVYTSIQCLSDYTKDCLRQHQLHLAYKCFCFAETLYKEGDGVVKKTVDNIFIDSLCSFLIDNIKEQIIVQSIIPANLYRLFLKHKRVLDK